MLISDWSSDVCSSDLSAEAAALAARREVTVAQRNRIPDPEVGVRAGRIDYGGVRDQVFGVSLSLPLFVRNSYGAEVIAALAEAKAAEAPVDRSGLALGNGRRLALRPPAAPHSAQHGKASCREKSGPDG